MLFQINGLTISNLQKAEDDLYVNVDIVANHLTEDSDGEIVLKEAFDKETIDNFMNVGVIDFWHESKNPTLTKAEKMKNVLGSPVGFRWENGKPVVTARLTKSHPIVQDMIPHLQSDQPVYAASIGGSKMVLETVDGTGKSHRIIPKIKWDHLAIAPANNVINREKGLNVKLLQKANEIMCEFNDLDSFKSNIDIFGKEEELRKALLAPSSTQDLQETSGGVLTEQSIEKDPKLLTFSEQDGLDLIDTIIGINQKRIPTDEKKYFQHFEDRKKKDFGQKSYGLIDKYFKTLKKERR